MRSEHAFQGSGGLILTAKPFPSGRQGGRVHLRVNGALTWIHSGSIKAAISAPPQSGLILSGHHCSRRNRMNGGYVHLPNSDSEDSFSARAASRVFVPPHLCQVALRSQPYFG